MKEPVFTNEENLSIIKHRLKKNDKKEVLGAYFIYLLPSLVFLALSLKTENFELCFFAYIVLMIPFLYILYYGFKAERLESGIIRKYSEHFENNKEEKSNNKTAPCNSAPQDT